MSTIKIDDKLKQKLKEINPNATYEETIKKLVKMYGGALIDDVITIEREQVAFTLKYMEYDTNNTITNDITYQDLYNAKVGDVFTANPNPIEAGFINSGAEVVFKKGSNVILLVEEVSVKDKVESIASVVHIHLF